MERVEEDWGEWGTIYLDEAGRLLGSLQDGPSHRFPREADLPAGPPSARRRARDLLVPHELRRRMGREVAAPRQSLGRLRSRASMTIGRALRIGLARWRCAP
jgi:hypothetical protein